MKVFKIVTPFSSLSKTYLCWLSVLAIYLLALLLQAHIFLNWDVSLLMHTTARLLSGGEYGRDFFDTDPPMILYLYALPVFLAKLLSTSYVVSSCGFTLLSSLVSLLLCQPLIKKLEQRHKNIYSQALLLPLLAAIMLLPPAMNFAQREHFMLMFVLPYLFVTALRMDGEKINRGLAFVVGLLAGIGFAIKPHFYLAFLLVEAAYWWQVKTKFLLHKLRLETGIIGIVALCYLLAIALFHSGYLLVIVPTILQYYYQGLSQLMSPLLVVAESRFLFSLTVLGAYFIFLYREKIKPIETVLFCAILGFDLAYLTQKTYWYYHVLPAFSLACLLWIQLSYRLFQRYYAETASKVKIKLLWVFAGLGILWLPSQYIYELNEIALLANKEGDIAEMINHLRVFPPQSRIYFFSGCLLPYPAVDYLHFTEQQLAQTYWFMPGIVFQAQGKTAFTPKEVIAKTAVLTKIVDDFIQKAPNVVVIDKRMNCNGYPFNFLAYFSADEKFKGAFKKYRAVDAYDTITIYQKQA